MKKHAVITGATGGIGRECTIQFCRRKDWSVTAIGRSAEALSALAAEIKKKEGVDINVHEADLGAAGFAKKAADAISSKYKSVDALVNNAGMLVNKPYMETSEEEADSQWKINVLAPFLLIQAMMPLLLKSEKSHVVNIGSMGGFQGSLKFAGLSAYSAAKGGLALLTECLAAEFAGTVVAFNCLALGSADTPMLRKAHPGYRSPVTAEGMAAFITDFAISGHHQFNGKVLPVAGTSV